MVVQQASNPGSFEKLKLMEAFEPLEDSRRKKSCRYPLQELLLTALCAISAAADDWVGGGRLGQGEVGLAAAVSAALRQRYRLARHLQSGVCAAGCRRVRGMLRQMDGKFVPIAAWSRDPRRWQELARLAQRHRRDGSSGLGVGQRGRGDAGASQGRPTRATKSSPSRSCSGCWIYAAPLSRSDAMGCQREIVKQICEQEGDYIIAVKNKPAQPGAGGGVCVPG